MSPRHFGKVEHPQNSRATRAPFLVRRKTAPIFRPAERENRPPKGNNRASVREFCPSVRENCPSDHSFRPPMAKNRHLTRENRPPDRENRGTMRHFGATKRTRSRCARVTSAFIVGYECAAENAVEMTQRATPPRLAPKRCRRYALPPQYNPACSLCRETDDAFSSPSRRG